MIRTEIDAAVTVGKAPQAIKDIVTGCPREIDFGNPCNFGGEVSQKLAGIVRAALGDVAPNPPQVFDCEGRDY